MVKMSAHATYSSSWLRAWNSGSSNPGLVDGTPPAFSPSGCGPGYLIFSRERQFLHHSDIEPFPTSTHLNTQTETGEFRCNRLTAASVKLTSTSQKMQEVLLQKSHCSLVFCCYPTIQQRVNLSATDSLFFKSQLHSGSFTKAHVDRFAVTCGEVESSST